MRVLALLLPICLIILLVFVHIGAFGHWLGHYWFWVASVPIGIELILAAMYRKKVRLATTNLSPSAFELGLLVPLLDRLRSEDYRCSLLRSLHSQLGGSSNHLSRELRKLALLVWLLDLLRFEYFALLALPLLWRTNLTVCVERWRRRNGEALRTWLISLSEFDALLCLARHSYENPADVFPTLASDSRAVFQAEGLGHPLLDREKCVRCDLNLDVQGTQLMMVSGSNMSGKSTLLRSIGINSVLAFAGAPVRATRLLISPLQIGCSIVVNDSFLLGKSRFQAEVERLKWILDLCRAEPSLFLLDEVLGGTNSQERFWGARAVIEQLLGTDRAIGLVTTHDLALAEIVFALHGRAINVHFEEHYENGEMRFDYVMRTGTLTRTNGLNVMAALGLLPKSR